MQQANVQVVSTFVVDGSGPRGYGRFGDTAALGYEQDGERYDTLTMTGCADCTVAGNSLLSFNRERPVIRLGADRETGTGSRHNHVTLNKILPSTGAHFKEWTLFGYLRFRVPW